jgi:hypothetical protein
MHKAGRAAETGRRLAAVTGHSALAAASTLVSIAFAGCTFERWIDRRRPNELAWTIALVLFAGGAASLWWGAATGWHDASFRLFYALGAVVNVPVLALGTVWLLARPATAKAATISVALLCAFAFGVVVAAPLRAPVTGTALPQGSDVFGAGPRVLAAVGSGAGALVLLGGAVWSAARLARRGGAGRLVVANTLIALGTLVLSAGGVLNSAVDAMDAFAISLVAGISVIFVGFLVTTPRRASAPSTTAATAALPRALDAPTAAEPATASLGRTAHH